MARQPLPATGGPDTGARELPGAEGTWCTVRVRGPEGAVDAALPAGASVAEVVDELAAHALRAGLVDECRLFLSPVIVGGGKPALPDGLRIRLGLHDERRFGNGVVYLRYLTRA